MQVSWKEDPKKCTFIVLALEEEAGGANEEGGEGSGDQATEAMTTAAATAATSVMAGDVNLFFNDYEDSGMCEVRIVWPRTARVLFLDQIGTLRCVYVFVFCVSAFS